MQLEIHHRMQQPVDRVFAFISEPRNRPNWQRSIRKFEMTSDGEPRLGMKWREQAVGAPPFEMEITAYEPGRLWAERGESGAVSGALEVHFKPEGEATRLQLIIRVELRGLRKLLAPFIWLLAPREIHGDLDRAEKLMARTAAVK